MKLLLLSVTLLSMNFDVKATNCSFATEEGKIVSANCSGLGLKNVPDDLPTSLVSLNLSRNNLASLILCPLCGLHLLQRLDLSENQIRRLESTSFSGLQALQWLSLRFNRLVMIAGTFPDDVFKDLTRLEFLDLHRQPFEGVAGFRYPDVALSSLTSLKTLKMDGLVTDVDLGPGFAKLENLEVLDMNDVTGYCQLTSMSETLFLHLNTSRPLTLNLTNCDLKHIHNRTFFHLPTLHSLDLTGNKHLNIPPFVEASRSLRYTAIKVLNITRIHRETKIKIRGEDFRHLAYTWLEVLVVSNVEAYDVELQAMFNLPTSMTYLSFYDNNIIRATCLLGLYLMPNMVTLQVSRQNHYHHLPRSRTELARPLQRRNTDDVDTRANKTVRSMIEKPVRGEDGGLAQPTQLVDESYESEKSTTEVYHEHQQMKKRPKAGVLSSETPGPSLKTAYEEETSHEEADRMTKRIPFERLTDPSVCLNSKYVEARSAPVYEVVKEVKSFLQEKSIHSKKHFHSLKAVSGSSELLNNLLKQNMRGSFPKQNQTGDVISGLLKGRNFCFDQNECVILPPSIRFAFGREMKLGYVLPRLRFFDNSLEIVDLAKNSVPCFIGPLYGLKKLRSLDLSNNYASYVSQDFFVDMASLTHLYLQGNSLGDSFAEDMDGRTLSGLSGLKVLNLNGSSIKRMSEAAFHALNNLTHLSLGKNAMTHFRPRVMHMTSLSFIDLSGNSIEVLHRQNMDDFDAISASSNLTVDLRQNPLSCGCDSLEFWYWVSETRVRLHGLKEYRCTLGNGSTIEYEALKRGLDSLWLQCQGQNLFNLALGMLGSLLFLLSLFGVLHYKRWRLRYFYYVGLRRYRRPYEYQCMTQQGIDVRDVFISFDDEDTNVRLFVQDVLRPKLDERGISYYISEIDFAGRPIKDIIPEAVLGARKTLALFSSQFFPSYERELEFNMAVYHEETMHRRVVVPVLLERVDWSEFPPEVLVYLEENTYVWFQHDSPGLMETLMNLIQVEVRI